MWNDLENAKNNLCTHNLTTNIQTSFAHQNPKVLNLNSTWTRTGKWLETFTRIQIDLSRRLTSHPKISQVLPTRINYKYEKDIFACQNPKVFNLKPTLRRTGK